MKTLPRLSLRLLGAMALERDGRPCELAYEKGRALLAYLAAEPQRPRTRESLAATFWPDLARETALTNLRQVLHDLRKILNAASPDTQVLQTNRETVQLNLDAGLDVDLTAFSLPLCKDSACLADCPPCLLRMEALVQGYRGPFLADCTLPGCPEFESWLQIQREELHVRMLGLLARLSDCHEQGSDVQKALQFALSLHQLEPWNDAGLLRVMRLHACSGRRGAALDAYEAHCRALKAELGVSPSSATRMLAESLRSGEWLPGLEKALGSRRTPVWHSTIEKRQVTVLYCKLAALETAHPDDALALLRLPQARCSEIVRAHAGHLVHAYGGSFLAYFGYPQVVENAARLAVQAALALAQTGIDGVHLSVGVHTGVVISGGESQVPDTIGVSSGVAMQTQSVAGPGEVVISAATHRLIAGFFECSSLGPQPTRPLELFRVARSSGARDRLEAAATLTPFIGRLAHVSTLRTLWNDVCAGARCMVLLRGEAGIGKSRLALHLRSSLAPGTHRVREIRCFPEHSQSPFFPLTALLGQSLTFASDDSPEARFDKLVAGIETAQAGPNPTVVALFAGLMGLPLRPPYHQSATSSEHQREETFSFTLEHLYRLARQLPVWLLVEDLHWADHSTIEFLKRFIEDKRAAPIFAVFTARPEFQAPWRPGLVHTLSLDALDDCETASLVATVAPQIETTTLRRIVERSDGVPLFAEEMARTIGSDQQTVIPPTLHDLLAARMDRLGEAKQVAQWAAALGREFDLEILQKVAACTVNALAKIMTELRDTGLVLTTHGSKHQFRHALIQEAAYESQTKAGRQEAHRRIAQVLQDEFPDQCSAHPELLARHWSAAGDNGQAIDYWLKAGTRAMRYSACNEAIAHFEAGLALIPVVADDARRVRQELALQIGLGAAACAVQGYASTAGARAYERAVALCHEHEAGPETFRSVWGLWASSSSRSGYGIALELARQLQRMVVNGKYPVLQQQAHFALGNTLYWRGDFGTALTHLDQVEALYLREHHLDHIAGFGEDAGVTGRAYRGWLLWFHGFPDRARDACNQSLALARQLGHPYSLAYALTFAALLHCRLRECEVALTHADEAIDLAHQHGFHLWRIGGSAARGWALAQQGVKQGAESLQQCVEMTRLAMGGVSLVVLGPLVDAHLALGHYDAALAVQVEAVAAAQVLGDHHIDSELLRLKGEALLRRVPPIANRDGVVESCFREALMIAKRQQARSLELRAAVSLALLWQSQGSTRDASDLLGATFAGFSEGFATPDLRDARALLDALELTRG